MNGLCLIITGGEYAAIPDDIRNADYVIACDRGWQYAQQMGIKPDLIIGDFDSSPRPETDIPILQFPSHKDDTDTMLAAREALKHGYKNIAICCAFGARLDHAMANIQTAAFLVSNGANVRLSGKDTEAWVFTKGLPRISVLVSLPPSSLVCSPICRQWKVSILFYHLSVKFWHFIRLHSIAISMSKLQVIQRHRVAVKSHGNNMIYSRAHWIRIFN